MVDAASSGAAASRFGVLLPSSRPPSLTFRWTLGQEAACECKTVPSEGCNLRGSFY